MGYNANPIIKFQWYYDNGNGDNFGWMGGIAVLNSEIYFSDRERDVIIQACHGMDQVLIKYML